MTLESRNPATGRLMASFEVFSEEVVEEKLDKSWRTYQTYRHTHPDARAEWLRQAADILEQDKHALARVMTEEMGKPVGAAVAEAVKCALGCRYYADNGARFIADEQVETSARKSWVRYEPIGPVLAVMPWNFPFWQVFRFAAPALMAGNVALLKHASNVPRCALAIEDILRRAGFPDGAFQTLLIDARGVSAVLEDARIRAATLTGSTRAGAAVAEQAGRKIKKTVLELGGSDPFIVMPSAEYPQALRTAVTARTINNGQSCIAAKRFIVHESLYDRFLEDFVGEMEKLVVGDPLDPRTQVGPLATGAIRDEVHQQVKRTVSAGARLLTGGKIPEGDGYFYPPTVLDDIPRGTPAYDEEIFGPVASVFRVRDVDEAIELANDTVFGLGSSVWTTDEKEIARFVEGIEAGQVFVNAMVASDPRLPFGGVKESGYGRELGVWGLREFTNVKTVWIGGSAPMPNSE